MFEPEVEYFAEGRLRYPWTKIVRLYQNVERLLPPGVPIEVCSEFIFEGPTLGRLMRGLSVLASPARLIYLGNRFGLERTFSHLKVEQRLRPDGIIDLEIAIPPEHEDCPQFFRVTAGVLEAFPRLLGLPDAEVSVRIEPRKAVYRVVPPPSRTVFALASSWVRRMMGAETLVEELTAQRLELNARIRELKTLNRELETALAARDRFLEIVRHELLTPLNGLEGSLDTLESPSEAPVGEALQDLRASARRLQLVVADLLEHARARSGPIVPSLEPTALPDLLRGAVEAYRARADRKGLELIYDEDPRLPLRVRTDGPRLARALGHLIDNAVKFTDAGWVRVEARLDERALLVTVTDSGPGIAKEVRETIFDAFSQADGDRRRRHGGLGLRLTLARLTTEALGGRLWLDERTERGARFHLRAPLEVLEGVAPAAALDRRRAVLVVDDDEVNRRVLARGLEKLGLVTLLAKDGLEGAKLALREDVSLVIMDYEMPKLDGVEATRRILAEKPDLLVLGWSASARAEVRSQMLDAGVRAFLDKPISAQRLEACLRDHGL